MEEFINIVKSKKAVLEKHWHGIPPKQRRNILLYAFSGYLVLTLAVLLQVVLQIGNNTHSMIEMRHITNPVAKPSKGDTNNTSKTSDYGK